MFDQRRVVLLCILFVCADYSICMWLGDTITILCPHLLLFLSLCGGDCISVLSVSVYIPLAKTEIPTYEIEGNGSVPVCHCTKQRSSWMSKEIPIQKQKEEKAYRSLVCTRLHFFRKRSWCSNWRKNKERQVFGLFPFLLLHDRTPVRPFSLRKHILYFQRSFITL